MVAFSKLGKLGALALAPAVLAGTLALAGPAAADAVAPAGPVSTAAQRGDQLSLSDLTSRVMQQIHALYPHAYLVEIDGKSPDGPTTDITKVTSWTYRVNDTVDSDHIFFISVTADLDGTIGPFNIKNSIWLGSTPFTSVDMEPKRADELLKAAGYADAYQYVTLRRPNAGGPTPHPLYIFGVEGHGYVGVDTATGEVKPMS
ncbi:hypothetical protein AB0N09_42370 [Streptomyces erythrochromogenes]|uniref:hypothetical protein n=1 Tax=Streptomyces erythrochromogenes TaxID=285574 RepID=UPI0034217078